MRMGTYNLHGKMSEVAPKKLPSLKQTQLLELITQEKHGAPFSFNILYMKPGGEVEKQSHPAQHAVFVVEGRCSVLLGEQWVTLNRGGYAYIPPDLPHSFVTDDSEGAHVLILKI
jgi:quercetin dioxygenase-like cupin family protein